MDLIQRQKRRMRFVFKATRELEKAISNFMLMLYWYPDEEFSPLIASEDSMYEPISQKIRK